MPGRGPRTAAARRSAPGQPWQARTRPGRPAFPAEPPPGPAMPVTESAMPARECASAPAAISSAVSRDTAPMRIERRSSDAEHLHLGLVGIGDEAAVDDIGRAGNVGERRRDHAAGAGFGGGEQDAVAPGRRRARRGRAPRTACCCDHSGRLAGVDDARRRDRRDAFLAADEAEPLVGRRLDRDALGGNRQHAGKRRDHRRAVRADARRFGDQA